MDFIAYLAKEDGVSVLAMRDIREPLLDLQCIAVGTEWDGYYITRAEDWSKRFDLWDDVSDEPICRNLSMHSLCEFLSHLAFGGEQ